MHATTPSEMNTMARDMAVATKEQALARLAFCENEIRLLKEFIATAEELVAWDAQQRAALPPTSSTAEILAASEDILARRGTPQRKGAIYEELVARGIRVPGRSPRGNLTAKFATRKDVFRFDHATGLWSLVRWGD